METAVILTIIKTLFGAIVFMYILAIPVALKMASFSKNIPGSPVSKLPWFGRFMLAWLLYPLFIVNNLFKIK